MSDVGGDAPLIIAHQFFVHGEPEQQGSTRAFVVNGRAHITTTNKNLHSWRDLVKACAQDHAFMHTQAVAVTCNFYMPKPKSAPKKKKIAMTKRPDIDKLARAILDALTGILFKDDSQVIALYARKFYAEAGESIGVDISVHAEPEPVRRGVETIVASL